MKQRIERSSKARILERDRRKPKALRVQAGKQNHPPLSEAELHIENMLDEASRQSFPASDPPAWISSGR